MKTDHEHIVVIPAHGHGSRIRELTGGKPKTMLTVAGQPILWRLLSAAMTIPNTHVIIYVQPGDDTVATFLRSSPFREMVEVKYFTPQGYLPDMVAISKELGQGFTVLDSDLVVPMPELTQFVRDVRHYPPEISLIAGVTLKPKMDDPRVIWLTTEPLPAAQSTGYFTPQGTQGTYRLAGTYHWCLESIRDAEQFLSTSDSASFHTYTVELARRACLIGCIPFRMALNVNTPADLARASAKVKHWRQEGWE